MSARQGRALLAMGFLALAVPARAQKLPHRIVWNGTVTTTEGFTGTFTARTHYIEATSPEEQSVYFGHFRCRGRGCPWRRGNANFLLVGPDGIGIATFQIITAIWTLFECRYYVQESLPGFRIDGPYECRTATPPFPSPPHVVSTGTMTLAPMFRLPSN